MYYTVEPPNNGHVGDECFVHYSEDVPSSEVLTCIQLLAGGTQFAIVGSLSALRSVHYRRFRCIHLSTIKYTIQQTLSLYIGPSTARVECTARFNSAVGMQVTCIVNSDFTGNGITSIRYSINDQEQEEGILQITLPQY